MGGVRGDYRPGDFDDELYSSVSRGDYKLSSKLLNYNSQICPEKSGDPCGNDSDNIGSTRAD